MKNAEIKMLIKRGFNRETAKQIMIMREQQKMRVINETILALLCISEDNFDLNNRYLIGIDYEFSSKTQRYKYFAYIDNQKTNITKNEYKIIKNLWTITKNTKNELYILEK